MTVAQIRYLRRELHGRLEAGETRDRRAADARRRRRCSASSPTWRGRVLDELLGRSVLAPGHRGRRTGSPSALAVYADRGALLAAASPRGARRLRAHARGAACAATRLTGEPRRTLRPPHGRPGAHPQLLDHRPHRPRQVDAGRPHPRDDAHGRRARDARAAARLDGPRARARHHDQGAGGARLLHGARRRDLPAAPDRHARATSTSPTRSRARWPRARARCSSSTPRRASRRRRVANTYLAVDVGPRADPVPEQDRPARRRARARRRGGRRAARRARRRRSCASAARRARASPRCSRSWSRACRRRRATPTRRRAR